MKTKVLVAAIVLLFVLMLSPPVFAVKGPVMDELEFRFYGGSSGLFTGLLNNEIDFMAWPLTKTQYDTIKSDPRFTLAPYFDMGDYEIGFNNNYTKVGTNYRNPMNYTEFRQAVASLIDKDGLMASPAVGGFGTRIDTPIARPVLESWVNYDVSQYDAAGNRLGNYPWEYNVTRALELLYNNGWYLTSEYPTFDDLLNAYTSGALNVGETGTSKAVYPPGHEKAGERLDNLIAYVRNDHEPRLWAGRQLTDALRSIGIQVTKTEGRSGVCYVPVYVDRNYHFYTAGWSYSARPLHFYSMFTPIGIYPDGPNFYCIDNGELTYHAILQYPNSTGKEMSMNEAKICQRIIVENAHMVPLFSSRSYLAYRTGMCAVITTKGYGLTSALDYTYLDAYHETYPAVKKIRHGSLNPPEEINPIFASWLWDYHCIDRMFTSFYIFNPYAPEQAGKPPLGSDQPWMAKDWKYELGPDGNAIVTLWFRDDIYWHDGVKFTVDDVNYTIYLTQTYTDSWGYSDMIHVVNFEKIDDYTCKLYFDFPSYWSYLTAAYDVIPKHIYEKIPIKLYPSTDGHRGYWPGENEINPDTGAKWKPEETWVGTNMWKYKPGTQVPDVGGGITFTAFDQFWMKIIPGEIDFVYEFDNPANPPSGGRYKVGLSDLVLLANAYGTQGNGTGGLPFILPGVKGAWNPAADLATPAGKVGLSDLVTLAKNYGKTWGEYDP